MNKEIVIIDDDEDLLKMLAYAFEAKGFNVQSFQTGKAGLSYLLNTQSDINLLILDRLLPDMEGLDILRKYEKTSHLSCPVLVLSMLSAEKDVLEGLQLGAIDYVTKPFSLPILIQKAEALMGRAT